jgi:hypothetical protein
MISYGCLRIGSGDGLGCDVKRKRPVSGHVFLVWGFGTRDEVRNIDGIDEGELRIFQKLLGRLESARSSDS